jgi:hypothetical protein
MSKYIYVTACMCGTRIYVPVRLYSHVLYEPTLHTYIMYLQNPIDFSRPKFNAVYRDICRTCSLPASTVIGN